MDWDSLHVLLVAWILDGGTEWRNVHSADYMSGAAEAWARELKRREEAEQW